MSAFERTEGLLGKAAVEKLKNSRVALFGVGGVGGYVAEALIRSGLGHLDIFDNDIVQESNINRQIIALRSTLGQKKVEAAKARLNDINPFAAGVKFIAAMGAGNKKNPLLFQVADISETRECSLARVMRRELKKRGVEKGVKCVFSTEQTAKNLARTPNSIAYMPSVMGLIMASEIIKDLTEEKE